MSRFSFLTAFSLVVSFAFGACAANAAEPLSKSFLLDFFRDVPSRNLKGMATRSDGRLVGGPVLTDLTGPALPELLWCLEPAGANQWLIGTGPEGRIVEVTLDSMRPTYTARDVAKVDEPQVLALKRLPDATLLAGTSPNGVLALVRGSEVVARVPLPVDSIFELVLHGGQAYAATGNPGRIYKIDLAKFARAGVTQERVRTPQALSERGIELFGEVRDRNVRRITWIGDRLVAGSSPKGNLYAFSGPGASPEILQENRDAEVAALLPQPNGDLFAALVFAATQGESRISRPAGAAPGTPETTGPASPIPPTPVERFNGRSTLVYLPKDGFPETVVARANLAFYALARRGNVLLISGGEQGDVLGYDIAARQSLSFAGSDSAQVNALAPVASSNDADPDRFLALRNNAPGLALIDFAAKGPRSVETRRLDLGVPAQIGALRVGRLVNAAPEELRIQFRGNLGSDEIEGWSPWVPAERKSDGWAPASLRARNVKLRLQLEGAREASPELDNATLFYLPQNRRPQLAEFRVISPNFALIPAPEPAPALITTLAQLNAATERDDKRRVPPTNSQVVPQPGSQIITWHVTDPDGDTLACTFSLRREGAENWVDLAVATRAGFTQFNTTHFEDGLYFTRLSAAEQAPRPAGERLSVTFDTEPIVIDNTAPELAQLTVRQEGALLRVSVGGHDALSLLEGASFAFNNGITEEVTQPSDGIRDSQTETFELEIPAERISGASSVEVSLYDAAGNQTSRRAPLPQ